MECVHHISDEKLVESIKNNANRAKDYCYDGFAVISAKTKANIEDALNRSPTEMYCNNSDDEIKDSFKFDGIKYSVSTVKLYLLSYAFYNLNYHMSEGIDWGNDREIELPPTFPSVHIAKKAKAWSDMIRELLPVMTLEKAIELYEKYFSVIRNHDFYKTIDSLIYYAANVELNSMYSDLKRIDTEKKVQDCYNRSASHYERQKADDQQLIDFNNEQAERTPHSAEYYETWICHYKKAIPIQNELVNFVEKVRSGADIDCWIAESEFFKMNNLTLDFVKDSMKKLGIKPNIKTIRAYISAIIYGYLGRELSDKVYAELKEPIMRAKYGFPSSHNHYSSVWVPTIHELDKPEELKKREIFIIECLKNPTEDNLNKICICQYGGKKAKTGIDGVLEKIELASMSNYYSDFGNIEFVRLYL